MVQTKQVKFYYFRLRYTDAEGPRDINLFDFFDNIRQNYTEDNDRYIYEFQGENAKLSYVGSPADENDFFQLTFERLRDFNYPVRAKLTGDSRPLTLEEGEFLGEVVTVLFDHRNNFLMVQYNRDSLSYKAIELFLNWLINNEVEGIDGIIDFQLAIENNPTNRVRNFLGLREVLLKMNIAAFNVDGEGSTYDFFTAIGNRDEIEDEENFANDLDVEIKITVKNKPSSTRRFMPNELAAEALSYEGSDGPKKLQIKGIDEAQRFDTVNLIENKLTDSYRFNFREDRQLRTDVVYDTMKAIYIDVGREKLLRNP